MSMTSFVRPGAKGPGTRTARATPQGLTGADGTSADDTGTDRASAAWCEGDHPGDRLFADTGALHLERGGHLPSVRVAYETWGELDADGSNAVLVEHALTGDSHVVGPTGEGHPTPGWWEGMVGPGAPIDTDRYFVVAPNVLGGCQGTTGPSSPAPDGSPWGARFPEVTIRDQVAAEVHLADALGISRWAAVVGGSMGGMRAIEWAVAQPSRVERAVVLASTPYATAEQIGWSQAQVMAIRNDPHFADGDYYGRAEGPEAGLSIARQVAHVTYRSELELHDRFGRRGQSDGEGAPFAVESYLEHHGTKLAGRFDANSYIVLTEAMNSHDVGRGRGGLESALRGYRGRLTVAAVDSDRLYPPRLTDEVVALRPGTTQRLVTSRSGHDGFLTEIEQVATIVREALDR